MAKTEDQKQAEADQATIEDAVTRPPAAKPTGKDAAIAKAQAAELARQQAVVDAVAGAGDELAALGGPLMEPGLGR